MAQSRLEKIGTIFTRVNGLLRSGAIKYEDRPIWYDVYAAFPPTLEPKYDRPAPKIQLREIFYEEDVVRAKYHKNAKPAGTYNLSDSMNQQSTSTQQFIGIYKNLKEQGAVDDEQIFETAKELLSEKVQNKETEKMLSGGLSSRFSNAKSQTVDIKDIFKE